jgi:hypothetical protein
LPVASTAKLEDPPTASETAGVTKLTDAVVETFGTSVSVTRGLTPAMTFTDAGADTHVAFVDVVTEAHAMRYADAEIVVVPRGNCPRLNIALPCPGFTVNGVVTPVRATVTRMHTTPLGTWVSAAVICPVMSPPIASPDPAYPGSPPQPVQAIPIAIASVVTWRIRNPLRTVLFI